MKAASLINRSLFRTFGGTTQSISSSIMIAHPLQKGIYTGQVFKKEKLVGEFEITCTEEHNNAQADVDVSSFIGQSTGNCECKEELRKYPVKDNGYVFFYSAGGDDGFHVELKPAGHKEKGYAYTTRKLEKGDIVVSLLMRPGYYEVSGNEKEKASLTVETPKDTSDYQRYLSQAVSLTLGERGFSNKETTIAPGQGLVITLESGGSVAIKLVKPADVKEEGGTHKPRWQKQPEFKFKKRKKK